MMVRIIDRFSSCDQGMHAGHSGRVAYVDTHRNCGCRGVQISKLLNIPFVALVEAFWLKKSFSVRVIATMAVVVIGVAIV